MPLHPVIAAGHGIHACTLTLGPRLLCRVCCACTGGDTRES